MRRALRQMRWLAAGAALAVALAFPALAWADEDARNQVYPGQLSDSSFLYETSIADLAQADSYYENQTVLVSGEVTGDCVNDEISANRCWITLQDDEDSPSIVAVVMDKSATEAIDTYGRYGQRGTMLQVRGTFHLTCREHQGMSDIHAEEVSAVAKGDVFAPSVDGRILVLGIGAVLVGLGLLVTYHVRRERLL